MSKSNDYLRHLETQLSQARNDIQERFELDRIAETERAREYQQSLKRASDFETAFTNSITLIQHELLAGESDYFSNLLDATLFAQEQYRHQMVRLRPLIDDMHYTKLFVITL